MSDHLKANGILRDPESECFVSIAFSRRPTDDELRQIHDILAKLPSLRSTREGPLH